MMRILVRLPNWVGDALLALPSLEGLVAAAPGELIFAGRALPLELTGHLSPASRRFILRKGSEPGLRRAAAAWAFRRANADVALLLTPSFSSALIAWGAGIRERVGWPVQGRGSLLTTCVPRGPRGAVHITREFEDLIRTVGPEEFPRDPQLPFDPAADQLAARHLRDSGLPSGLGENEPPLVALCPGVKYGPAKQWPIAHFKTLREELEAAGIGGILVGAPEDQPMGEAILSGAGPLWQNLAGAEGGILASAALIRRCRVAVCNDTGVMHLAAAVGTPVAALFGPTDPRWTGPRGPYHRILREPCECSPCYERICPHGQPAPCLAKLSPGKVLTVVRDQIQRSAAGQPAVFLDRDGTLCELVPYLADPAQATLIPGAADALRQAARAGYRLVVVSNQSGVARDMFDAATVEAVNEALARRLAEAGVRIDRFEYCPHHPEFTGPCLCRKPGPGMLRRAAGALGIDLRRSWMIGDAAADLEAGARAGCRSLLVRTGYGAEVEAELGSASPAAGISDDLPSAIRWLLDAAGSGSTES